MLNSLEVYLPYGSLVTGIQMLAVFQNLRWNSNKTFLLISGEREKSRQTYLSIMCFMAIHFSNKSFNTQLLYTKPWVSKLFTKIRMLQATLRTMKELAKTANISQQTQACIKIEETVSICL